MKNLKLTIDLLPRGAWGNDLSNTLPKKDWDKLRQFCYKRFEGKCSICGAENEKLHAHEVWKFDINNKTQTLIDILALCPKCHGVKHFRNSERLGYSDNAKRHFMQVNNCKDIDFANHYTEEQFIFDKLSKVYRWKVICDLSKFGGEGMQVEQRYLPMITNPYNNIEWYCLDHKKTFDEIWYQEKCEHWELPPRIRYIDVDNYAGAITFVADYTNKIEMWSDDKLLDKKFNLCWKFVQKFSVENIKEKNVYFKLYNTKGIVTTAKFELKPIKFE